MDTKKSKNLKNDFYTWCERNNKQPKSLEEVQDLLVTFITENKEKYPEEYTKIKDALKQKTTKALHGAKLNYFKSLKHQCAEDEEVVYYKKGGSVTCGCKKKEDGGEIKKAESGWRANFNNRKNKKEPDLATKDSIAVNRYGAEDIESTRPGNYKKNKEGKILWTPDRTKAPYNKISKKEKGGKAEKDCGGSRLKLQKKGGEICPKCGKVHAAGMGCAVVLTRR